MKLFSLEPDPNSPLGLRPEVLEPHCPRGGEFTLTFYDMQTGEQHTYKCQPPHLGPNDGA